MIHWRPDIMKTLLLLIPAGLVWPRRALRRVLKSPMSRTSRSRFTTSRSREFSIRTSWATTLSLTFIKVDDRQYIELFPEKTADTDRLLHISIEVEDAEAMRGYLRSKGVRGPDKVAKGRIKNSNFMVTDPDGHLVEDGFSMQANGKFMGENKAGPRISRRISHLGIVVGALEPAMKFYGGILGFQEIWRGSKDGKVLSWVNMKVPEGDDYLEFMLYDKMPDLKSLGTLHHICLEVPDIEKTKIGFRPYRSLSGTTSAGSAWA